MTGYMMHGMGDCTPERNCGCLDRAISDERLAELRDAAARSRFPTVRAMLSDLVAEVDRLRGLLDGMTDEWGYRTPYSVRTENDGLRFRSRDDAARWAFGRPVVHRRVTEWQEVQP